MQKRREKYFLNKKKYNEEEIFSLFTSLAKRALHRAVTHRQRTSSGRRSTHHQVNPDGDHQFEPDGELGDDLGNEGRDGVSIVWLVELRLVQTVHQDDVVILRDLPLCSVQRGQDEVRAADVNAF